MEFSARRGAFAPALLLSLALHAAAAAVLWQSRHPVSLAPPQPLTVMLEPAAKTSAEPPPARPLRHLPTPLPRSPEPSVIALRRVDAVPLAAPLPTPAALAPAPAPAAPAIAAAIAAPRSEAPVEPPHFNVGYLNNPRPHYPAVARRRGLEGLVLLRVEVSAAGTPETIVIAQTSGTPVLDEAAMRAVQGWTFVPARRGETPIAHPVDVPIRFQLRN